MLLDKESWTLWYELENLEGSVDSWCCKVVREGAFEEEVQSALHSMFEEIVLLKVNFCIQCGKPLGNKHDAQINYEDCCCKFASKIEFIEIYDPRTYTIHRLRANFCFNCGSRLHKKHLHN